MLTPKAKKELENLKNVLNETKVATIRKINALDSKSWRTFEAKEGFCGTISGLNFGVSILNRIDFDENIEVVLTTYKQFEYRFIQPKWHKGTNILAQAYFAHQKGFSEAMSFFKDQLEKISKRLEAPIPPTQKDNSEEALLKMLERIGIPKERIAKIINCKGFKDLKCTSRLEAFDPNAVPKTDDLPKDFDDVDLIILRTLLMDLLH